MRPVAALYCLIRYGAGHWMRTAALAAALTRQFRVSIAVSGDLSGDLEIPDGVTIESMPMPADDFMAAPADGGQVLSTALGEWLQRLQPAVFLLESYPFGRQHLVFEMARCLNKLRSRPGAPLVVSSVRDIQQRLLPRQDWLNRMACNAANRYFDAVLVHTDPRIVRFEETFPEAGQLMVAVHETGYVVPDVARLPRRPSREPLIVVSAGGGRGGESLLRAACDAQRATGLARDFSMRILAGTYLPDDEWQRIEAMAAGVPRLELRRWSPALGPELAEATVSVSRCGYNTALDLVAARVPALVVPFVKPTEDEQTFRAAVLERRGAWRTLPEDRLTPESLAAEIRRTASFEPAAIEIDTDGGRRSTELLAGLVRART